MAKFIILETNCYLHCESNYRFADLYFIRPTLHSRKRATPLPRGDDISPRQLVRHTLATRVLIPQIHFIDRLPLSSSAMSFFWDLKTIPIFLLLSIPKTTCRECGSSVQERVPQIFSFYHGQQPNPALFDQRPSIRTLSNGTCRSSTHSSAVGVPSKYFFQPYLWKAALANCASPAIVLQGVSLVYRLNYDPQEFLLFSGFTPRLRRVTIDGIRLAWLPSLFANLTFLYYTHDSSWKASRFINTVDFEFHILLRVPA